MKKALLSIVKFFGLTLVFLAFSLAVNANKRGFKNLADSSKAGSSRFMAAPFKKAGSAYKYKASIFGNALAFDGWNDYVTMGSGLTLPESGWTEEMWIYVPEVSPEVKKLGMLVIGSDDMTVWSKRGPFLFIDDGNTLYGGYGYGTGQTQKTYSAHNLLIVNAWNHIAQTYDGRRLKAYINGKKVVDEEAPEKPNANPIKYLGGGFLSYYYFQGSIDELRIWNRARSAEEIKNNYDKIIAPNNPALLLYYSFNQGIAGGDNTGFNGNDAVGISFVTDSKGRFHGVLNNFNLMGVRSNFVTSFVKTTANEATNITEGSFTANWAVLAGTVLDKYLLEVARDDKFTNLVPGYENLEVLAGATSWAVSGLSHDVTYYYRVKAVVGRVTGPGSNIISVKTHALSGFGNALNFDGDGDFVTMEAGLTLPESGWTEEMWIYLPEVSPGTRFMGLIGGDDMTVWSKRGPFLQIHKETDLHGGYGYGTGENQKTYSAHNVLAVNAWNHVAQTYDGSSLKAYVNGNLVADVEAPEKPNANPIKYLGGPSDYNYFKGSIDELRIWNRARSAEKIKNNYDKTVAPDDSDLLLYYSFNQGIAGGDNTDISSVTDSKGKFDGVFNNFALNGSSSNFVASLVKTTANEATNITEGSFTANWAAPADRVVNKYRLEVSRDDKFTNLVPGYENLEVPAGATSWTVNGLSPDFTYYYRVKVVVGQAIGPNSNAISVKTQAVSGLEIGNMITPNGDGVNDTWIIENIEHYPNATVKVFDRARRLVFSQTNYDNKWNGYYNGRPLRQGAYYYVISIGEGKNIISKGYLTIINKQ